MEDRPELLKAIQELTAILKKRTSYRYRIFSGLLTGVATAIGATVIAGIVIYLLSDAVQHIDFSRMPGMQDLIDASGLTTGHIIQK